MEAGAAPGSAACSLALCYVCMYVKLNEEQLACGPYQAWDPNPIRPNTRPAARAEPHELLAVRHARQRKMNRTTITVRRLDGRDESLKGSAVTL